MNRHLLIALAVALLAALGVFLGTRSDSGAAEVAARVDPVVPDEPDDERRVQRFEPDVTKTDEPEVEAPPAAPTPADPAWGPLHGRFRNVMGGRIQVVVPDEATQFEAHDLQMDTLDARTTELDDLIVDLTELAETTTDTPTKVDALVSLGEVYLELSSTVESTPVPEWMRARRARRLTADIEERSLIATDKARMVFQMAQSSGGEGMGSEMAGRIANGLAATE